MNLKRFFNQFRYLIFAFCIFGSHTAFADHDSFGFDNYQNQGVIVYRDCDFSGKAARLNFGDYSSLRNSPIGNDSISSIRVPRGMIAIIYENDNFEGEAKRVFHDVRCVPNRWNDRISSIRIVPARDQQAHNDWGHGNNYPSSHHDGYDHNYPDNSDQYGEYQYNDQQQRCHNYKVYAYGGAGAFRITDESDKVIKVNNNTKTGSTCRRGNIRIELSKNQPNVTTALEINGRRYTFAANEQHDSYKNNWYRKYIDLYLP